MACRTETTDVDGLSVVVTQWPVTTALRFKMRFAKLLGPAIATFKDVDVTNMEGLENIFAEAIAAVFESENSDPELIVTLIKDSLTSGGVNVDGQPVTEARFTELFSGDGMALMYRVLFFVYKVNFGDLIAGRFQKGKAAAKTIDSPTAAQDTQT